MAFLDTYPFLRWVKSPITDEQLSPLDSRCNVVQFDSPLLVVVANQFQPEDFKPFVGHSNLKAATIGLGSIRKNKQAQKLLGLPKCEGFKSKFIYN